MDDGFDSMAVAVRADMDAFRRDVLEMRQTLETGLGAGAEAAGRGIEAALARAARGGRMEFEDLAKVAARALGEIAAAALRIEFGGGGGLSGMLAGLAGAGLPGRATGGPVSPGRAYLVGEAGPELFVPTASGRIEAAGARAATVVNLSVQVQGGAAGAGARQPQFLAETGRQVARAVRQALVQAER